MADSPRVSNDEPPLYEGEERIETVTVGDTRLVVTTHRLFVRPESDPSDRRVVDRANLGAIKMQTRSARGHVWSGIQWGLLGLFLLGAWQVVPFGGLVRPIGQPPAAGLGGLFAIARALVDLLAFLDEAFLLAGVVAVAWSVVRFVQYVRSRERTLEIAVVGADPIRLSVPPRDATVERLRELLTGSADRDA